jgi:hypothetical protein
MRKQISLLAGYASPNTVCKAYSATPFAMARRIHRFRVRYRNFRFSRHVCLVT